MMAFRWIFFVLYLATVYLIGVIASKKSESLSGYYVADRGFGKIALVGTFTASYVSAAAILGYSAFAYRNGWSMLLVYCVFCAIGWILLCFMGPKINRFKGGFTTPAVFEARFDSRKLRLWIAIVYIIWQGLFLIQQFMGIGYTVETFLHIPYQIAVMIIGVTLVVYIALGGMRSVVWSDVMQGTVMVVGVLIAAATVLSMTGGFGSLNTQAAAVVVEGKPGGFLNSVTGGLSWGYIIGNGLPTAAVVSCVPFYHRMFLSAKSPKDALGTVALSTPILIVFFICLGLAGVGGHVLIPNIENPDQMFPTMVASFMHPLVGTLILTCIAAGIMSSMDSLLLAVGIMFSNDIFKGFIKKDASEKAELSATRLSIIVIGLMGIMLSLNPPGSIMDMYNLINTIASSALFPALFLGLFWKRATGAGALSGSVAGFVSALLWRLLAPGFIAPNILNQVPAALIGIPVGFIVILIVSLKTPPTARKNLKIFFDDVDAA